MSVRLPFSNFKILNISMLRFYKAIIPAILLFIITTLFGGFGYAQSSNWLALSNGGGQSLDLKVDAKGNVYSLGKEGGEMEFRSATDEGSTHHSNVPWSAQFITKHTPNGTLSYVIHIIGTGSNSNTTTTSKILILKDNRIAVGTYCKSDYQVIDGNGDSTKITQRSTSLLIFSEDGKFQSHIPLPIDYAQWMYQMDDGSIYAIGREKSYFSTRNSAICRIDLSLDRAVLVEGKITPQIHDVVQTGNTLWFLDLEVKKSEWYYQEKTYRLTRLVSGNTSRDVVQTYTFGLCHTNNAQLTVAQGMPQIVFQVIPGRGTGIEMNDYHIPYIKDYTSWLFVDAKGEVIKRLEIDGMSHGKAVTPMENGDYLLRFIVYDSLFIEGEEPITVPHHRPYIYEMCFVQYSNNFKKKDIFMTGGVNSSNLSPIVIKDDFLYVSGVFYDDNEIDGKLWKLEWSHGYFVRKRKMGIGK